MSGDMKHFSPDLLDVIVGGAPISGFAENSLVSIVEDDDRFTIVKGVDGGITRSMNLVFLATLTIHLMSSSRSNDVLSALHLADISAPGGAGVVPVLVRDKNGTSTFAAPTCWIIKPPDAEFTNQASPRDWKIACYNFKNFVGGT